MKEIIEQIRTRAEALLSSGRVDCVIGYKKGTVPMQEQPFFCLYPGRCRATDLGRCFAPRTCANFLIGRPGKKPLSSRKDASAGASLG